MNTEAASEVAGKNTECTVEGSHHHAFDHDDSGGGDSHHDLDRQAGWPDPGRWAMHGARDSDGASGTSPRRQPDDGVQLPTLTRVSRVRAPVPRNGFDSYGTAISALACTPVAATQ